MFEYWSIILITLYKYISKLKQTNRKTNNWKNKENKTKNKNIKLNLQKKHHNLKQTNMKTND